MRKTCGLWKGNQAFEFIDEWLIKIHGLFVFRLVSDAEASSDLREMETMEMAADAGNQGTIFIACCLSAIVCLSAGECNGSFF